MQPGITVKVGKLFESFSYRDNCAKNYPFEKKNICAMLEGCSQKNVTVLSFNPHFRIAYCHFMKKYAFILLTLYAAISLNIFNPEINEIAS